MNLADARIEIDRIDEKILSLFARRMELGGVIGKIKESAGLPVENSEREREILLKITRESGEDLGSSARILFSTLFELSKSYQRRLHSGEGDFGNSLHSGTQNLCLFDNVDFFHKFIEFRHGQALHTVTLGTGRIIVDFDDQSVSSGGSGGKRKRRNKSCDSGRMTWIYDHRQM